MNQNKILVAIAFLVVLAAVMYAMSGGETPEQYQERIEKERDRQFKFLKYNAESPLDEEQKKEPGLPGFFIPLILPLKSGQDCCPSKRKSCFRSQ